MAKLIWNNWIKNNISTILSLIIVLITIILNYGDMPKKVNNISDKVYSLELKMEKCTTKIDDLNTLVEKLVDYNFQVYKPSIYKGNDLSNFVYRTQK